jgi:hypothetical protein
VRDLLALNAAHQAKRVEERRAVARELKARDISADYLRQMPRRWRAGEVYAPHDLSPIEMNKWRKSRASKQDVVDMLGISPLDMYRVSCNSLPPINLSSRLDRISRYS